MKKTWHQELHETWETEYNMLCGMKPEDKGYNLQNERVSALERQLCELEKMNMEADLKWSQLNEDKKTRRVKAFTDVLGTALPLAAAIGMSFVTMKWEDFRMNSTTAGKACFRDLFRFRK